jgi:hypothetical protein
MAQEYDLNAWVIVSFKHNGLPYWRPNSAGYTESIVDAGKYSREEAEDIVFGNHKDDEAYAINDPSLLSLLSGYSLVRGKELELWLKLAALSTPTTIGDKTEGGKSAITPAQVGLYYRGNSVLGCSTEEAAEHYWRDTPILLDALEKAEQPTDCRYLPGSWQVKIGRALVSTKQLVGKEAAFILQTVLERQQAALDMIRAAANAWDDTMRKEVDEALSTVGLAAAPLASSSPVIEQAKPELPTYTTGKPNNGRHVIGLVLYHETPPTEEEVHYDGAEWRNEYGPLGKGGEGKVLCWREFPATPSKEEIPYVVLSKREVYTGGNTLDGGPMPESQAEEKVARLNVKGKGHWAAPYRPLRTNG